MLSAASHVRSSHTQGGITCSLCIKYFIVNWRANITTWPVVFSFRAGELNTTVKMWPAPPAGLKCICMGRCSGWIKSLHRWVPHTTQFLQCRNMNTDTHLLCVCARSVLTGSHRFCTFFCPTFDISCKVTKMRYAFVTRLKQTWRWILFSWIYTKRS